MSLLASATPFSPAVEKTIQSSAAGREKINRILLIRLKSIGDVVFTLPATQMVRDNFPEAAIHFLTSRNLAPMAQGFPAVDEVMAIDRDLFQRLNPFPGLRALIVLLRRLRKQHYTLAVDFQGFGETAFLAWMTGAPRRWGGVHDKARRHFYTGAWPRDPQGHPIDGNRQLLHQGGLRLTALANRFVLAPRYVDEAKQFLLKRGLAWAAELIFIQPFTSSEQKNWPLENYVALARRFKQRGAQIVFGGGLAERARLMATFGNEFPFSAGVDLLTNAALLQQSALVVGGDTGLLHLGVALQKRVVMIMGYNHPGSTIPYLHPEWTIIPPPGGGLPSISVDQVDSVASRALLELRESF